MIEHLATKSGAPTEDLLSAEDVCVQIVLRPIGDSISVEIDCVNVGKSGAGVWVVNINSLPGSDLGSDPSLSSIGSFDRSGDHDVARRAVLERCQAVKI